MYCKHCGAPLPQGALHCPACGRAITPPAGTGGFVLPGQPYTPPGQPRPTAPPYVPPAPQPPLKPYTFHPQAVATAPPSAGPAPQATVWAPPATAQARMAGTPPPIIPVVSGGQPQPATPPARRKKGKTALAVIAVVVAIGLLSSLFYFLFFAFDPVASVRAGFDSSLQLLLTQAEKARQDIGVAEVMQTITQGAAKSEVQAETTLPGMPGRLSLTGEMAIDYSQKKMEATFGMGLGGASLMQLSMQAEDDLVVLGLPGLLENSYGLRTRTFGQDYQDSNLRKAIGEELDPDLSFDFFSAASEAEAPDVEPPYNGEAAGELWQEVTATSEDRQEITVLSSTQNAKCYAATLPGSTLAAYLEYGLAALLPDAVLGQNPLAGFDIAAEAGGGIGLGGLGAHLRTGLTGPAECMVYLQNNLLVRLEATLPAAKSQLLVLEVGTLDAYGDELSLALTEGSATLLRYTSRGDKTLAGGSYSQKVQYQTAGSATGPINIETRFDPSATRENYSQAISIPTQMTALQMNGTLAADATAGTIEGDFSGITVDMNGQHLDMSMYYTMAPAEGHRFATAQPDVMVLEMTESDLRSLAFELILGLNVFDLLM